MESKSVKISGTDVDRLAEFVCYNWKVNYSKKIADGIVLAGEEFRFRNSSDQMFLVIIERKSDALHVELVCGGGGEGLFSFTLGSERAFIKRARKLLKEYCETNMLSYEEVE